MFCYVCTVYHPDIWTNVLTWQNARGDVFGFTVSEVRVLLCTSIISKWIILIEYGYPKNAPVAYNISQNESLNTVHEFRSTVKDSF